jgi:hypothetical protein
MRRHFVISNCALEFGPFFSHSVASSECALRDPIAPSFCSAAPAMVAEQSPARR